MAQHRACPRWQGSAILPSPFVPGILEKCHVPFQTDSPHCGRHPFCSTAFALPCARCPGLRQRGQTPLRAFPNARKHAQPDPRGTYASRASRGVQGQNERGPGCRTKGATKQGKGPACAKVHASAQECQTPHVLGQADRPLSQDNRTPRFPNIRDNPPIHHAFPTSSSSLLPLGSCAEPLRALLARASLGISPCTTKPGDSFPMALCTLVHPGLEVPGTFARCARKRKCPCKKQHLPTGCGLWQP